MHSGQPSSRSSVSPSQQNRSNGAVRSGQQYGSRGDNRQSINRAPAQGSRPQGNVRPGSPTSSSRPQGNVRSSGSHANQGHPGSAVRTAPGHSTPGRPAPSARPAPGRPGAPAHVDMHRPVPRSSWNHPYLAGGRPPRPYHYADHHYFGYRLHRLPPRARFFCHYGLYDYYYYDGIYYRPFGGGYIVCRPPFGERIARSLVNAALTVAVINAAPDAIERAHTAARISSSYARANADYTARTVEDYYNTSASVDNGEYYYQDGVFYALSGGEYIVIEPPVGALVKKLPEDYQKVNYNGEEYYQVDSTLYKLSVVDGDVYFEVVCNL